MERLTFEGNFCDISVCLESPCPYNGSCTQREVWERLKAYENLMDLDRLQDLALADREGRLSVRSRGVGRVCGECENFVPGEGKGPGWCKLRKFERNRQGGLTGKEFRPYRTRRACANSFEPKEV